MGHHRKSRFHGPRAAGHHAFCPGSLREVLPRTGEPGLRTAVCRNCGRSIGVYPAGQLHNHTPLHRQWDPYHNPALPPRRRVNKGVGSEKTQWAKGHRSTHVRDIRQ